MLRDEKLQECREMMVPYIDDIVYISDSLIGGEPEGCITSQNRNGSFTNYRHFPTSSQVLSRF